MTGLDIIVDLLRVAVAVVLTQWCGKRPRFYLRGRAGGIGRKG